jgi:SAM-dependent methyltransferase
MKSEVPKFCVPQLQASSSHAASEDAVQARVSGSFLWDLYARCYDDLRRTIPYQRLLAEVVELVPADAGNLLDAGCGTGNLLQLLQQRRPAAALHGFDCSKAMLRRAKAKLSQVRLSIGDLDAALPYADSTFDVVTCINTLYAVAHPARTLTELRRVLKFGGALIVSSPLECPRMFAFLQEHAAGAGWWRTAALCGRLGALVLINSVIFRRGRTGQYHFMDIPAVRKLIAHATISQTYAGQNWLARAIKEY